MVALEQRTWIPAAYDVVEVEGVLEAKGPVEAQVGGVGDGEFGVAEEGGVLVDEAVAEGGPGEHVDCDGVRGGGLEGAVGS